MHIQEGTNTTLTTCTKMTEEVDRRHGVNGNSSSKSSTEDAPVTSSALNSTGGRLKFFKDGKFILELVRGCAREGERAGWVSVPRKTFWPPPAAPGTPAPAPPAPLSLSDDNSSVQSSPWQRDHCWKQAAPRRHRAAHRAFYYCRPSTLRTTTIAAAARRKRRRPYDTTPHDGVADSAPRGLTNGVCDRKNGDVGSPDSRSRGEDVVDAPPRPTAEEDRWADYDREKYYHMKLKKPYQYRKLRVYKKTGQVIRPKELTNVINKLRERVAALPAPVNAKLASCRQEHALVSPRKRILREMERVSLEDQSCKRRAKTAPALSTASFPPAAGPSHAAPRRDPPTRHVGSYSIQSLLSMPDERRSPAPERSPAAPAPARAAESPAGVSSPEARASPEWRRHAGAGAGCEAWRARWARREEWPLLYYAPAPLYRAHAHAHAAPPLWLHYPAHAPPAPSPWAPLALPLLTDHIPKDEPTSDLPLNLSKH